MRRFGGLALILWGMFWLLGCGAPPGGPGSPEPVGATLTQEAVISPGMRTPTLSPVVLPTLAAPVSTPALGQTAAAPTPTRVAYPTPAVLPFDALFPTAPVEPQEAPWRPPTYPTPWAPTPFDHFLLARPIAAFYGGVASDDYRYGGVFFGTEVHTGVDIRADPGTPVLAAGEGRVVWAGPGLYYGNPSRTDDPYGLAVLIRHPFGWEGNAVYTLYAHLSKVLVQRGDWVSVGAPIGLVGTTGHSTGPHLHFEVRIGTIDRTSPYSGTRNPDLWLVPPIGWGVLVGQVRGTGGQWLYHHKVYLVWDDGTVRKVWRTYTYAQGPLTPDSYYRENYTVGDLPAGRYTLKITYNYRTYTQEVDLLPGQVTYFVFRGSQGFTVGPPPLPEADWQP